MLKKRAKTKTTKAAKPNDSIVRRRMAQVKYTQRVTREGQDIGDIPKVANPKRRKAATDSFRVFCETYFSSIFYLPWSKDLLRIIAKIEQVVIHGQTFAVAMPRGSGKTRLCQAAALWAMLTGRHPFIKLIGAVGADSKRAITWFKAALSENQMLHDDWPEICYPIWCLEGEVRRCIGQRHHGERTNIGWGAERLVMPTIPGSESSGFVIDTASLEGHIRGAWVTMPDGRVVRPTLAICDDPQTAESARSQGPTGQTTYRLRVINEDVQGLAGPDRQTAILVPCTVICPGDLADQLLNRREYPDYRGERTKRFYSWPTNKGLWEEYREIRDRMLRNDQPLKEATEFYRARMATCGRRMDDKPSLCAECKRRETCMDCGAQVDWADRMDDPSNLSAVQATMHAFYKYKAAGFAAEFQNEPLTSEHGEAVLTAEACAAKINGRQWAEIPIACTELTMAIDVQQSSLWYVVVAWEPNFTGYVVDYGVWPRQARQVFTLSDIVDSSSNLQTKYPGGGSEGAIHAGLEDLVTASLSRDFRRSGGAGLMRIGRILVDAGHWPTTIASVKHKVGGATMMLSKGVGIKAGHKPMSLLKRKPGEKHGHHWYMPSTRGTREFPFVLIDTNYWKSFVHRGLMTPSGDPGAISIFGDSKGAHALFASHITAETYVRTHGHGRDVEEWTPRPQRPDNHWLDAMVYACVAASYQGVASPSQRDAPKTITRKKRVAIADLLARSNQSGG